MTVDLTTTPLDPPSHAAQPANLADILERVLDKGVVIAGDIKIDLLDIELLTIRLRLFVSSVDTARKAGIDWWETDPALSSRAAREELREENRELRARLAELERLGVPGHGSDAAGSEGDPARENATGREKATRREKEKA
ncbi:gas vesicle protein [Streptomyces sp. NRRL F-5630]|uniref:gas vesicle protein n=1 Tax=Streptomyces sp. NRRL F-5630 TaxID=1463864 RepID=UPI003EB91899